MWKKLEDLAVFHMKRGDEPLRDLLHQGREIS